MQNINIFPFKIWIIAIYSKYVKILAIIANNNIPRHVIILELIR